MKQRSIGFRLTIWYSLALAAGLIVFALAIWFSMRRSLLSDLDTSLTARARSLAVFIAEEAADPKVVLAEEIEEFAHGLPRDTYIRVADQNGSVVFETKKAFPWPATPARIGWLGMHYDVFGLEAPVKGEIWQISIAGSRDPIEKLLDRVRLLLVTLTPLVIVVAVGGGAWLGRRALKPVDRIIAAAKETGIANLSERLVVPETGDELQRLSETWNAMMGRLEAAVKRLSRFTADASHELRTPLGVIRATAEIAARKSRSPEEYQRALKQIVAESERMTLLLEDLLFLARCDSESVEMPMVPLPLGSMLEELCGEVRPLAESRAIRVTPDIGDDQVRVMGNESALRRLILVLLDNAIVYSNPGGEVEVRLRRNSHEVCVEVTDNGRGISTADLPHIFDRFYRSRQARDQHQGGYGLGLSLAAGIAQRHAGRIEVDSVPEHGSTFRVFFSAIFQE